MHFDIDYMDGYRVFTWNEKDYGDPAGTIQELADDGFKAVCIIDPGVKLDPGYENMMRELPEIILQRHRKGKSM